MNQPERAAKLSGAAQALITRIDYQPMPYDESERERHIQIARQQIGKEAFDRYAEEGSRMTLEKAVAYAFEQEAIHD